MKTGASIEALGKSLVNLSSGVSCQAEAETGSGKTVAYLLPMFPGCSWKPTLKTYTIQPFVTAVWACSGADKP